MKHLITYILESKTPVIKYKPSNRKQLDKIIKELIESEGNEADLSCIDVSKITDMSYLFTDYPDFNGNVAGWNVSKVNNFEAMFSECKSFEGNGIETWEGIVDTKVNYPKGIARNYSEMFLGCESFDASEKCEDWQPHNGKTEWGIIVVDGKDAVEQGLVQDKYDFPSLDEVEDMINDEGSAYIDGEEYSSVEEVKDYYISVWDIHHPDENDILEYLEEYWENTFDSCIDIPFWYDIEEVDYHYKMGGGQSYMR